MMATDLQPLDTATPARWRDRHASTLRQWRLYAHLFRRSFSSMLGLLIVVVFLVLAAGGSSLAPYPDDPIGAVHLDQRLQPPSLAHTSVKIGSTPWGERGGK